MIERTYTYSPSVIRKAFWELTWLTQGGMLLGLILLLIMAFLIAFYNEPWLSGFLAGAAIAYFILVMRSYFYVLRMQKAYKETLVRLSFNDHGVSSASDIISSSFPWSSVIRLQTTRSFLFLTLAGSTHPMLIPISILSKDDIEFIRNQFNKTKDKS